MYSIQRAFLRAKHWEIFVLFIFVSLISSMATSILKETLHLSGASADSSFLLRFFADGYWLAIYLWTFQAGSFLNSISPAAFRVRPTSFYFSIAGLLLLQLIPFSWPPSRELLTLALLAFS